MGPGLSCTLLRQPYRAWTFVRLWGPPLDFWLPWSSSGPLCLPQWPSLPLSLTLHLRLHTLSGLPLFDSVDTCVSRRPLAETVRSLVDALRGALAEIEADSGAEWEVVDSPRDSRVVSGLGSSSASAAAASSAAPLPAFAYRHNATVSPPRSAPPGPSLGDPLSGEALCLVNSLRPSDRLPRATRAWQSGLQAGAVLRGERTVVEPTPAGDS